MSRHTERNAHVALSAAARERLADAVKGSDAQPAGCKSPYCEPPWCRNCGTRERRSEYTRGFRQLITPGDAYAECQQQLIEAGVWPVYTP